MKLVYTGGGPNQIRVGQFLFDINTETEVPDEVGQMIVKNKTNFIFTVAMPQEEVTDKLSSWDK